VGEIETKDLESAPVQSSLVYTLGSIWRSLNRRQRT